jgi:hypothetical protein
MTEPITERDLVIAAGMEILGAASLIDRAERVWRDDPDAARNALREARSRIGAIIKDRNFARLEQVFHRARDVFERLDRVEKRLAKAQETLARIDLQRELIDLQDALKRVDQCEDEDALEALLNEIERRATRVRDRAQDRDALWNALLILGKIRRFREKRAASTSAAVAKHYPGGKAHDQKRHGNWARPRPFMADPKDFHAIFERALNERRDLTDAERREILSMFRKEAQAVDRILSDLIPIPSEWSGEVEELLDFDAVENRLAAKYVTCVIGIDFGRLAGWRAGNRRGAPTLVLTHELLHARTTRIGYRQAKWWEEGLVEDVSRALLPVILERLGAPKSWAGLENIPAHPLYLRAFHAMRFIRETLREDPISFFKQLARLSPPERRKVLLERLEPYTAYDLLRERIRRAIAILDDPTADIPLP